MCGIFSLLNHGHRNGNKYTEHIKECFMLGRGRGPEKSELIRIRPDLFLGFHRLAINGLDETSGQPLTIDNITIVCNGEIYNYKNMFEILNVSPTTLSDCEVIIHLYKKFGIDYTLQLLDGVFAFMLFDDRCADKKLYVARDPYGVRPLYVLKYDKCETVAFASEMKVLHELNNYINKECSNKDNIEHVTPGSYLVYSMSDNTDWKLSSNLKYNTMHFIRNNGIMDKRNLDYMLEDIYVLLDSAVKKRVVGTSDRGIACLLSGGLDSSVIAALVSSHYKGVLETYSIGLEGSEDLKYAEIVAKHIGSKHTSVVVPEEAFFAAIPEVILNIESYDTTTVRASVGNYLLGKYISANSDAKVIFNGDGSDEVAGGYLYFKASPSDIEFDIECKRLLSDIYAFDVLRSDKCISSHGLEPRTPFLDRSFVDYYLSIPSNVRNTNKDKMEKYLLRKSVEQCNPDLLPKEIVWRKKEAFSDGVSGLNKSWFQIIQERVNNLIKEGIFKLPDVGRYKVNLPVTTEQMYYRYLFEIYFPRRASIVPYFWMPKFIEGATDASARTLDMYNTA